MTLTHSHLTLLHNCPLRERSIEGERQKLEAST